jgi:NAD+ kinase
LIGLNDVIVHNKDARRGIRYKVTINNNQESKEIIGDGVVIATPFGSTAYYRSITDSFFEVGLGLAFNNSTEQADHMVLKDDSKISISITRGPALVYSDNKDDFIELENGDSVEIKKAENTARIIVPN